uniref:Reticulon 4 receptor n=1 Tax=Chelonoidis abingdonii TaxID=106734 RepID=A0A8C0IRP6_CHEAB
VLPGITSPPRLLQCGSKLLILVLCLNIQSEVESCPGACVCYSEPKITISCQQQGLTVIPTEIPIQTQRIFLHNNKITLVRSTSFTSCRNMTILWIHSNNISLIESGAFYGLDKLEELDLSDNVNLKSINPTTFRGLIHLHALHLDRCGLLELSTGLFRGLFSLQHLYLQDNNLQNLLDDTFLDLANLTYLFLHGNKIKSLSENVFRGLINLDRLLLHQNRVSLVHRRSFHDLGKVMTLYLFNNNLTVLTGETMAPLVSLQYLRLNGNQWICDCQAQSLWNWFKQFKGSSSELECHLPSNLAGRDLKRLQSSDLEGCMDSFNQIRTSVFSTKTRSGKLPTTDSPLNSRDGAQKCCQPEMDKSFIYEAKDKAGRLQWGKPGGRSQPSCQRGGERPASSGASCALSKCCICMFAPAPRSHLLCLWSQICTEAVILFSGHLEGWGHVLEPWGRRGSASSPVWRQDYEIQCIVLPGLLRKVAV